MRSFARCSIALVAATVVGATALAGTAGTAWAAAAAPQLPGAVTVNGGLYGITATSATNIWAVGDNSTGVLILHGNGKTWKPAFSGVSLNATLNGVAAISASDAWAVGLYDNPIGESLTLHWNGSAWQQVPNPAPAETELWSVSASSASNVWAVGGSFANPYPVALHWNGTTWQNAAIPQVTNKANEGVLLNGVSVLSATDAWAVGTILAEGSGYKGGVIFHWNGSSWARVSAPDTGSILDQVAATSPANVWAVGCDCGSGPQDAITLHWNGRSWTSVHVPIPAAGGSVSVVTATGNLVWAAGTYCGGRCGPAPANTFFAWTGKAWRRTPSPVLKGAPFTTSITGITAISATNAWAIGFPGTGNAAILHWNGKAWA